MLKADPGLDGLHDEDDDFWVALLQLGLLDVGLLHHGLGFISSDFLHARRFSGVVRSHVSALLSY